MSRSSDSETDYDISTPLDFDALTSVRPGSNILIAGPAMTGKEDLALSILADGSSTGEGAIVMTTNDRAANVVEDYRERVPNLDESRFAVVDCRGDGDRSSDQSPTGSYVHHVSSPGDLTGIGIGITKSLETLTNNGAENGRFALTSLSTMLTYTDKKTVFKFCHVLSSRFDSAGYLGLFTIDTGAHDEQTVQVIKQAFDGMIEIRETDGAREARVLGLAGQPTDWQEF
jgi:KaiC/GvpD/RAD55 family RecA-like ATPase